jgi:hypothetical protein
MNLHQHIMREIEAQYEHMREAVAVSPSALAHRAYEAFGNGDEDAHIQWASIEHIKQMARAFLRSKKDPDSDESDVYRQPDLDLGISFSGQLQDRYPIPRKPGEEPVYKLRGHLTAEERAWNIAVLRKSGSARLEHADALEAEGQIGRVA